MRWCISAYLTQVRQPVIIHWLGDMFDPKLAGYWGSHDVSTAMQTCLNILHENKHKIDGIKISLLDADREIEHAPPVARRHEDVYRR